METKLTAEVHLRKDTKYVYSSQCLATAPLCLPQVFAIVSSESGNRLAVGLAAVTALNPFLRRLHPLGLASPAPSLLCWQRSPAKPLPSGALEQTLSGLTGRVLGEECGDFEGLMELAPARAASLRIAAVHLLSLELSDGMDQRCNPEPLFVVTNVASGLMYARN